MNKPTELTYVQAKEKALRLLEFRSHSEFELKTKLNRAGAKEDDILSILDFCREYHFVDDMKYAQKKAKDLQHLKKFGKNRIIQELKAKGLPEDAIEHAIAQLDFENEEERLIPMIEKKINGDFSQKNIDKSIRYFLYRGFSFSTIKNCINQLKENFE